MYKVQFTNADDEGFTLNIAVNEQCAGAQINSITMYVSNDGEYSGDLAVNWSTAGLQNDEAARTMGTLMLRDLHSDDDVTAVMGEFYWQNAFTERLRVILQDCGFTTAAALDVTTSEWGMQDEGRASYDAVLIAKEACAMHLQAA